jgi:hypothetical protein
MKNSSDIMGNRTRDLPTCSLVPQPTALARAGRCDGHRSGRPPKTYVKPEAAITVFVLLMMGGVSSETR